MTTESSQAAQPGGAAPATALPATALPPTATAARGSDPDLTGMLLSHLIVHDIPKAGTINTQGLSNQLTDLEEPARDRLRDRIIAAMGRRTKTVELVFTDTGPGSFFKFAQAAITAMTDAEFIRASQDIASLLIETQTSRVIPGGVLVVQKARLKAKRRALFIIKCDQQDGFQSHQAAPGSTTIGAIDNLILTPTTALYKVAVIIQNGPLEDDGYSVWLFDDNMSKRDRLVTAKYFREDFLGATYAVTPQKQTHALYQAARDSMNGLDAPLETKLGIETALDDFLSKAEGTVVTVREFARAHVPVDLRDSFVNGVIAQGITQEGIVADTEYIQGQMDSREVVFEGNIRVKGPSSNFRERVEVIEETEVGITIRIRTEEATVK